MEYIYIAYIMNKGGHEEEPLGIYNSYISAEARVFGEMKAIKCNWKKIYKDTWTSDKAMVYIDKQKLINTHLGT